MHKMLGLQHHRHTGKRLQHAHTSHHALIFLLLVAGFAFSTIQRVGAATYDVSAKVSATVPSQAASIVSPTSGSVVSASSFSVNGTCEVATPAYIVSIWRNNILIGSTTCSVTGLFSINITLEVGLNSLLVRVENITNDFGPDGQILLATYELPVEPTPTPSSTGSSTAVVQPPSEAVVAPTADTVKIISGVDFIRFVPNQETAITIVIRAGDAPYIMVVDWGDGTTTTYTFKEAGEQVIKHTFTEASDKSVRALITDKNGKSYSLVLGATTTALALASPSNQEATNKSASNQYTPYVLAGSATVATAVVAGSWVVVQGGGQGAISAIQQTTRSWRFRVKK